MIPAPLAHWTRRAAAAVVAAAALSLWALGCSSNSEPGPLPLLVPTGLEGQLRNSGWDPVPGREVHTYFGQSGERPFEQRDVNIVVHEPTPYDRDWIDTVRDGLPAERFADQVWDRTSRRLVWYEDGRFMAAWSWTLSDPELTAFVDDLQISNGEPETADNPMYLDKIGQVQFPIYEEGYNLKAESTQEDRAVYVSVHRSQPDEMTTFAWGPTVADRVGASPALRFLPERGALAGFIWEYSSGVIVEVTGWNATEDELREVAESVLEVTQEDFDAIGDDS